MLKRGFKTWSENTSVEVRKRLGLKMEDPLHPRTLAEHLGVQVLTPEDLPELSKQDLDILLRREAGSWSAATIHNGGIHLVILNSSHSLARQASTLMHEIAHILLEHPPARIDVSEDGMMILNTYDADQEDEANWLAGCLLIPRPAALHICWKNMDARQACGRYHVSADLLKFRLNVTGAVYQATRARSAR